MERMSDADVVCAPTDQFIGARPLLVQQPPQSLGITVLNSCLHIHDSLKGNPYAVE